MKVHTLVIRCWQCGKVNNRMTGVDGDDEPCNGAVGICFRCVAPLIIDSTMPDGVRKPTPSEAWELMQDERIRRAMIALVTEKFKTKKKGWADEN